MKTNVINYLKEGRAAAKALRVFYIVVAVINAAGIILLICYKQWHNLGYLFAIFNFTIALAYNKAQIVDLYTCIIDMTNADTNLENAKREEIE